LALSARRLCRSVLQPAQIDDFAAGRYEPSVRRKQVPGEDHARQREIHRALEGPGGGGRARVPGNVIVRCRYETRNRGGSGSYVSAVSMDGPEAPAEEMSDSAGEAAAAPCARLSRISARRSSGS